MSAPRRVLFVLRGKLGDSIVAFASARAYADAHPEDEVALLVRANYAPLFSAEKGLRVIGFGSRLAMFLKLHWMRWTEPAWDALVVLLGFGPPVERLGRLVRARRRIYLDDRFREVYAEWPDVRADHLQPEPAWRAARMIDPSLAFPAQSTIPSLASRRVPSPRAVGLVPISDEPRRTMGLAATDALAAFAARTHPGCEVRVLVNREDRWAQSLLERGPPPGAGFRGFPSMEALVGELAQLAHLYTTDTGLYHLAVAMGVPTTVFYGPTQPWKNGFPGQPALARVRLEALGGEHCEEKGCIDPVCLDRAVSAFAGGDAGPPAALDSTPQGCLLRRFPAGRLATIAVQRAGDAVVPVPR